MSSPLPITPQESPGAAISAVESLSLEFALVRVAARAGELDRDPQFPAENFDDLRAAGVTQLAGERGRCTLSDEIGLVRMVAGADGATARILDGHFNGVERLAMCAPAGLREQELERVRREGLLVGVWGADPGAGEGPPARIESGAHGLVLSGVKTFCSGAGGVERALVLARDGDGCRRVAYVATGEGVQIDRSWYRASGLRASESHRVEFDRTPVLALLGGPDELLREPWFARDAIRSSATWAGISASILRASAEALRRGTPDQLALHGLGRMRVAQSTIERWLDWAAAQLRDGEALERRVAAGRSDVQALSGECRAAIADCARLIAAEAARISGSRALVGGGTLDRARRDLDLFLLQHRLDPKLVAIGERTLEGEDR